MGDSKILVSDIIDFAFDVANSVVTMCKIWTYECTYIIIFLFLITYTICNLSKKMISKYYIIIEKIKEVIVLKGDNITIWR